MRKIEKTSIFTKDIKTLPFNIQRESWKIACVLSEDVFDKRLNIRKLEGYEKIWRVTVKKDYRLTYTFDKEYIYLLRIKHRKDIYKLEF